MNRQRTVWALVAGGLSFLAAARGQSAPFRASPPTISVSGQFTVSRLPDPNPYSVPYFRRPDVGTNTELLSLEPSLLAISAERFKAALWPDMGYSANAPWRGKIFLVLHPARSTNDPVVIAAQPLLGSWNYRVELPDLITRNRCARALSGVLLLELANRQTPGRSAVVPAWLADGLARQIVEAAETKVLFTVPASRLNGIPETRLNEQRHGLDPLAAARRSLQNTPALTFEQLCWPDDGQMNGADGGVYLASAQLFVHELLALPNGPAHFRALLALLPAYENWQSAFLTAFRDEFHRPLDVEKWWALRVVTFAARSPGPRWTPAVSRSQLDAALTVPVTLRSASNALPTHADLSLQAILSDIAPDSQEAILQPRLRNLELVQLRLTPELAPVADGYRQALAEYLGGSQSWFFPRSPGIATTVRKLDALDARRRKMEAQMQSSELQLDLNRTGPQGVHLTGSNSNL